MIQGQECVTCWVESLFFPFLFSQLSKAHINSNTAIGFVFCQHVKKRGLATFCCHFVCLYLLDLTSPVLPIFTS